ncbi:interleukin-10 receptor subunit alpha [Periophthalmus magnuspinnatus]|uniref:interleukin-10 receptor subunit alpha n=1 Tax=Periophthalmus magnuspinnatus TaxID=409849 RepID=UPI00145ADA5B|nr:interleukin-10 receptor subunit alpha [Periophthalmus magnuspinnatus]
MDYSNKTPILVFFIVVFASCVPGQRLPAPENLQVNILDGEVLVHWDKPADAPSDVQYNVQFGRYAGEWMGVNKCTKITESFCDLTHRIEDHMGIYKVRVQLVAGGAHSEWRLIKKILPNSSELQPPSFTMWATSSILTVRIHEKPILRKLFLFGIIYTIYLVEKEQNKTTVAYLKDDIWDHQKTKNFNSLHWGKEYCVTIKVEGNGGVVSSLSPEQCVVLPEQEWIITAVVAFTIMVALCIAAFITAFILCYVKRPAKTPVVLKSPARGLRPLSIGEVTMEIVTDKGWFLSSAGTEVKHAFKNLPTTYIEDQKSGEEDRRPSTDSGVSIKSTSDNTRQEDSGCGSIGAQDVLCNYPIQDEGSDTLSKSDDSGVGLNCHSDASSLNLEDQESGCLNKSGEYHKQHLLTVNIHDCDDEDIKEMLPQPQLISVVSGYRKNASICTCSGANLCIWCCNQDNYRGQYKGLHKNNNMEVESYGYYSQKVQMDIMDRTKTNMTLVQMEETFPMLTSLSSFPLMEKERDFNMNDLPISLCDVEFNHH